MQSEVRTQMVEFRREFDVEGGTLILEALSNPWLEETTDLLTGVFGDSMQYPTMYR